MVARRANAGGNSSDYTPRHPPATTPEARENQMVALAFDLAQKQMEEGNASAQVIVHFLKFGSSRNRLEEKKIENENLLLRARVEQIEQNAANGDMYANAIAAMKLYAGDEVSQDDVY